MVCKKAKIEKAYLIIWGEQFRRTRAVGKYISFKYIDA